MKIVKGLLVAGVAVALLSGCGAKEGATTTTQGAGGQSSAPTAQAPAAEQADVVTTASIVNDAEPLISALSEEGNWIVAILNDVTVDQDVVVAGEFRDKNDPAKDIYRKLALYAQDENKNITAQYTLTVPKLTVQSENFRIQGGTLKGDVYVEANGFNLHETATVDGNIYYADADVQATAKIDGKVTGVAEVQ